MESSRAAKAYQHDQYDGEEIGKEGGSSVAQVAHEVDQEQEEGGYGHVHGKV